MNKVRLVDLFAHGQNDFKRQLEERAALPRAPQWREHCQHVSGQSATSGGQMWSGQAGQLQFSVEQHVLICLCFNSGLVV